MERNNSQKDAVLRFMERNGWLTQRIASDQLGVDRLPARISELKDILADPEKLNDEETAAVNRVREIFTSLNMIPCTACHYCVLDNDCPKDIRIPELFSCYNLKTTFQSWNQDYYYTINTRGHGKASDCLKCGKCEKNCPQHLPIRKLLEQVAGEFEKA